MNVLSLEHNKTLKHKLGHKYVTIHDKRCKLDCNIIEVNHANQQRWPNWAVWNSLSDYIPNFERLLCKFNN